MTPARFRWGIILIQLGVLMLFSNMGHLSDNFWVDLAYYAPFVLIIVGIEKIFTKSKLQFISYLSSIVLLFAGFYIAYSGSWMGDDDYYLSDGIYEESYDPEITKISAILDLGESDLTIRDSGPDLILGRFSRSSRKPKIVTRTSDSKYSIEMKNDLKHWFGGAIRIQTSDPDEWNLKFSDRIPIEIECSGKESDIHLNLYSTPLEILDIDADDASIYIKLGELVPSVRLTIDGRDSDLRLRIPKQTGIKVIGKDFGGYLKRLGFKSHDNGFVNVGYDTLTPRYEIKLDDEFSSFSVDFF